MKKGDKVPQIKFRVRELGEWQDKISDDYFRNKRVILFSLPGAFTPTCLSLIHISEPTRPY